MKSAKGKSVSSSEYIVRVKGYLPCRIVSRKLHRGEVQVQFQGDELSPHGRRMWFHAARVKGAEDLR